MTGGLSIQAVTDKIVRDHGQSIAIQRIARHNPFDHKFDHKCPQGSWAHGAQWDPPWSWDPTGEGEQNPKEGADLLGVLNSAPILKFFEFLITQKMIKPI